MFEPLPEKKFSSTSVDGLEDVFDTTEHTPANSEASEDNVIISSSCSELLTTEEAAKELGISARAVINRLKSGTLPGKQVQGKYRKEWRVLWAQLPKSTAKPDEIEIEPSEPSERSEHSSNMLGSTSEQPESAAVLGLLEQNKRLMDQLNALTYRNGYLEAQLESERQQVKLLTDQLKPEPSKWGKFWRWMAGQSPQE